MCWLHQWADRAWSMSAIEILRQFPVRSVVKEVVPLSPQTDTSTSNNRWPGQTVAALYILTICSIFQLKLRSLGSTRSQAGRHRQ